MAITKQDVMHTGKMADMAVSEQEAAIYEAQLEALFKWVNDLSGVDTQGVSLQHSNLASHLRPDDPVVNLELAKELRARFAEEEKDCAKVKKVL